MTFLRIAGRIRLNGHSLNAQGGGGTNYVEITKSKVSIKHNKKWRVLEVPTISGNMVKHWHFVGFVDSFRETKFQDNLTKRALRYNGVRFGQEEKVKKANGEKQIPLDKEEEVIKHFADADVHGFLAPSQGVRRNSLVKTSFILPTEDFIKEVDERLIYAVKHNRLDVDENGAIKKESEQMIFNREYATGLYGFEVVLDLGFVGIPQSDISKQDVIEDKEKQARIESAVKALIPMLSGYIGANLARAFPTFKIQEFIAVKGKKPLPALTHGFYEDYVDTSKKTVENAKKLGFEIAPYGYQVDFGEDVSSVEEFVAKVLGKK